MIYYYISFFSRVKNIDGNNILHIGAKIKNVEVSTVFLKLKFKVEFEKLNPIASRG